MHGFLGFWVFWLNLEVELCSERQESCCFWCLRCGFKYSIPQILLLRSSNRAFCYSQWALRQAYILNVQGLLAEYPKISESRTFPSCPPVLSFKINQEAQILLPNLTFIEEEQISICAVSQYQVGPKVNKEVIKSMPPLKIQTVSQA